MQSTRQNKIARLIQTDLSDIFLREMKSTLPPALVSVTQVRISPDLSVARAYISIMPIGATGRNAVMQAISDNMSDIRRRLGLRCAKQLSIIPHLEFYLDDSLDYIENIERLLKQ